MKKIPAALYWDFRNPARPNCDAAYVFQTSEWDSGGSLVEIWDVDIDLGEGGNVLLTVGPSGRTVAYDPNTPIYYC